MVLYFCCPVCPVARFWIEAPDIMSGMVRVKFDGMRTMNRRCGFRYARFSLIFEVGLLCVQGSSRASASSRSSASEFRPPLRTHSCVTLLQYVACHFCSSAPGPFTWLRLNEDGEEFLDVRICRHGQEQAPCLGSSESDTEEKSLLAHEHRVLKAGLAF